MKRSFTFLGTGTSQGIPVIGCDCDVCRSSDPKDKRLRVAGLVTFGEHRISVDAGPDFRQQMLSQNVKSLEAILLTHEHNDHIIGLDDIRPLYFRQKVDMPVYGLERVLAEVRERFSYFFLENRYPGVPRIELHPISKETTFFIQGMPIVPIEVMHGKMPIMGYRFGDLVYITDAKSISEEETKKIIGCKTLIINALHHRVHHSHFNLDEALAFIEKVQPERAWLTHMSHIMGLHHQVNPKLPQNVSLAYDGLTIDFVC
ncbi:MAG TPA: MBL fold metallo-hydrolase [Saprospiraceae bacterium]|nr:MBL fold metallo-hydrolase [Saprospiraceae bacterium]